MSEIALGRRGEDGGGGGEKGMLFIIEIKLIRVEWYLRREVRWTKRYDGILFVCVGCSWRCFEKGGERVVDKCAADMLFRTL